MVMVSSGSVGATCTVGTGTLASTAGWSHSATCCRVRGCGTVPPAPTGPLTAPACASARRHVRCRRCLGCSCCRCCRAAAIAAPRSRQLAPSSSLPLPACSSTDSRCVSHVHSLAYELPTACALRRATSRTSLAVPPWWRPLVPLAGTSHPAAQPLRALPWPCPRTPRSWPRGAGRHGAAPPVCQAVRP